MGQEGNLTFAARRRRNFGDGVAPFVNRPEVKCRDFHKNISVSCDASSIPAQRKQSQVKMMVMPVDERKSPTFKPLSGFAPVKNLEAYKETPITERGIILKDLPNLGNEIMPLRPAKGFCKPEPKPYFYTEQSSPVKPLGAKEYTPICHALPSIKVFADDNTLVAKNTFSNPRASAGANCKDSNKKSNKASELKPEGPGQLFIKPIKKHCATGSGELYVAPVDTATISASKRNATLPLKGNSRRKKGKRKSDTQHDAFPQSRRVNRQNTAKGDCIKDPSYANSGPSALTSGGHDTQFANSTSSSVDAPGYFSSHDLESKSETMLVTNEPITTAPNLPLTNSHYNSNNNLLNSKGNTRAMKYIVEEPQYISDESAVSPLPPSAFVGCENLGFDSYGQESPALDSSFRYHPFGEVTSLDPGYGSEKSDVDDEDDDEDDEESYSSSEEESNMRNSFLEPPQGIQLNVEYLMKIFPFINEATMFDVTIVKNSRGLGLALTGGIECENAVLPGLIRIRKLYPQTPAWFCGQLQLNDFILEANGKQLTGLTSHEALEELRTTGGEVHMVVCRAPDELVNGSDESAGEVKENGCSLTSLHPQNFIHGSHYLSPSPSFSACGEFEIQLQKVAGSLGFTLIKNDNSILGHTIRSLVKEPAISDGRLRPGDKLLSVNGTDMCGLSHEEAVHFLRTCPDVVVIRLYRDAMQTPVSPASPTEPEFTKPKALRKEARDMLTDLAFQKQCSPNLSGNTDTPNTPRRRRLNKNSSPDSRTARWESLVRKAEAGCSPSFGEIMNNRENSPFDNTHSDTLTVASSRSGTLVSRSSSNNSYKELSRASSTLSPSNSSCSETRPQRPNFLDLNASHNSSKKTQFTPPHEEFPPSPISRDFESLDSAPDLTSAHSDTHAFTHLKSCYRSVNAASSLAPFSDNRLTNTTSDHNISTHAIADSPQKKNALLKWKGVMFTPEEEKESELAKVVTIELTRGWNSRLGFSLKNSGENTVIVAIYADSVAARDGRLSAGDIILEVNGNDVKGWESRSVIEALRKTRGTIVLKVLQKGT